MLSYAGARLGWSRGVPPREKGEARLGRLFCSPCGPGGGGVVALFKLGCATPLLDSVVSAASATSAFAPWGVATMAHMLSARLLQKLDALGRELRESAGPLEQALLTAGTRGGRTQQQHTGQEQRRKQAQRDGVAPAEAAAGVSDVAALSAARAEAAEAVEANEALRAEKLALATKVCPGARRCVVLECAHFPQCVVR